MSLNINIHREMLYRVLLELMKSEYKSILGFKGWTLAYFMYWLPRFSTDLDFDLLWNVNWNQLLSDLQKILKSLVRIKDAYNKENTVFLLLDYGENEMNIKLEINKRTRKNDHFSFLSLFGKQILCMEKNDILTNKLVALQERKRTVSRDLFDVHYFMTQGFQINEMLLLERTDKKTDQYLSEVRKFIVKHFNSMNLLAGLGEVIDEKQKSWVKKSLIEETLELIDVRLMSLK